MLVMYAALGLIIGSFLTVCIYRIPLSRRYTEDESEQDAAIEVEEDEIEITKAPAVSFSYPPRSICPSCSKQLRWYHNIPLFSWIFLKGKCAYCGEKISARYPLVELLTALAAVLSFEIFGLTATGSLVFLFSCSLIVISFIDYDYYIIPNVISLPGVVLGLLVGVTNEFTGIFELPVATGVIDSVLGLVIGGGFLLFVSEVYLRLRKKEGLGMGDVKLLAMTGAFFGVDGALYTIFVGSFLGSIIGIFFIMFARRNMSYQLPFGPYLAAGTFLFIFTEDRLVIAVIDFIGSLISLVF